MRLEPGFEPVLVGPALSTLYNAILLYIYRPALYDIILYHTVLGHGTLEHAVLHDSELPVLPHSILLMCMKLTIL